MRGSSTKPVCVKMEGHRSRLADRTPGGAGPVHDQLGGGHALALSIPISLDDCLNFPGPLSLAFSPDGWHLLSPPDCSFPTCIARTPQYSGTDGENPRPSRSTPGRPRPPRRPRAQRRVSHSEGKLTARAELFPIFSVRARTRAPPSQAAHCIRPRAAVGWLPSST
jgi:hypothetical protein